MLSGEVPMLRILVGILLIVASVVPPIVVVVDLITGIGTGDQVFVAPGQTTLTVETPGRWYLYHDHETVHDGRVFNQSPGLTDGVRLSLHDAAGQERPQADDRAQITVASGGTSSVAVAAWDLAPGTYTVRVEGEDFEAVCSLSEMRVGDFLGALLRSVALSGLMLTIGVVVVVSGVHARRHQSKREDPERVVLADR